MIIRLDLYLIEEEEEKLTQKMTDYFQLFIPTIEKSRTKSRCGDVGWGRGKFSVIKHRQPNYNNLVNKTYRNLHKLELVVIYLNSYNTDTTTLYIL